MTNEDAIKEIKLWLDGCPYGYTVQAFTLAIKSLELHCKSCKYYIPYLEQFSSKERGDGYCAIDRMTPECMTNINCNDEFGCLDYEERDNI